MKEIKLNRTGRRPFGFVGDEVFTGDTKDHASVRWDKVRVFKTEEGYIMGIVRVTCMEGERDHFQIRKFPDLEALLTYIKRRLPYLEQQIKIKLNGTI